MHRKHCGILSALRNCIRRKRCLLPHQYGRGVFRAAPAAGNGVRQLRFGVLMTAFIRSCYAAGLSFNPKQLNPHIQQRIPGRLSR